MNPAYTVVLSGTAAPELAKAEFPRIIDCVKWAEGYGQPADRIDIYNSESGRRTAQYRRPRPGSYPAERGVWVNSKIY